MGNPAGLLGAELVAREAEQVAIAEFLDRPNEGPLALLLEGEAGIGKTSIWKVALSAARRLGYRLLQSSPAEAEIDLPYVVLGDLLDAVPEERFASLPGPLRGALDAALHRSYPRQSHTDQLVVGTALLRVLRLVAADQPVLIAVDDFQWVDTASMRVLMFASHRLTSPAIRLIATLRAPAPDMDAGSSLQTAFGHSRVRRLRVGPLASTAIEDLLLRRLERPLRRPELERICSVSAGNPFFALEIARFILDHPESLRAGEPLPVPQSLTSAVESRISTLPPDTREILFVLAALSRSQEALLHRTHPDAATALAPALQAGIVEQRVGRVRFTHPLIASAVYGNTDAATRRDWHARLASLVADPEERARQLALAALGPDAAIAQALEEAARSADIRGAPDTAAALAHQAAELTPPALSRDVERRQILAAEFCYRSGDAPRALDLLEAVLGESAPGGRPWEALQLKGSILYASGNLTDAERCLNEALSRAGSDVRAQSTIERDLIRVLNQQAKLGEALDHCGRLMELARRSGEPSLSEVALRLKAVTERHAGVLSTETLDTAIAVADGRIRMVLDESADRLHPLFDWAVILKWSDDFDRARALFKRALELTEGRDESVRAPILFHLAEMECWAGDWLLAAVYAAECERSVGQTGQRSYRRLSLTATALLHSCRGELEAARIAAKEALAISTNVGDEPYRWRALAILGSTELASGDAATSNRYFENLRGGSDRFRQTIRSAGDEVEALLATGRLVDAESVSASLTEKQQLIPHPWQLAIGRRCNALVAAARGDLDASLREFEQALAGHQNLPMPVERARTLLAFATVLRRAKRKRQAREGLEEAIGIFKVLGAAAWLRRAQAELDRVAPGPARASELTPTEARVAERVAAGRTNKEVASELFLSVKTVEANLSRVYAKLSVRSRSELAARMSSER